jgi:hypothetical protein
MSTPRVQQPAQHGGHHIDTDEKKAKLFHKGLTIQLHDHLILSQN